VDANMPLNGAQWLAAVAWWVLVLTVPASFVLALVFRSRYVRAVVRFQSAHAAAHAVESEPPRQRSGPAPTVLHVNVTDAAAVAKHEAPRSALRLRRRVLRAQFVSGLLFWWTALACIYWVAQRTAATMAASDSRNTGWVGWLILFGPPVVGWAIQGGVSNRVIWVAAAALGVIVTIVFGSYGGDWRAAALFAFVGVLALMGAGILSPSARGAGPALVVAFTQGSGVLIGLCAGFAVAYEPPDGNLTTPQQAVELAVVLVAFAAAIAAAWYGLHRIVRRYEAKKYSELQVALNGYWNLIALAGFAMALSVTLNGAAGNVAIWAGLGVFLCWIVFRLALKAWLWFVVRRASSPLGPLLLLRVFKGSSASQAFTDRFLAYWRFAGPVWMIGGPDLAGAQMEPTEFFAFLRRRLDELFVHSTTEIPDRVSRLDAERDPDARLRISELFCSSHTWQATVQALLGRAAVILLDLREYTSAHGGTRYEIFQIMNIAPIDRVLVLIGVDDDEQRITSELRTAWDAMEANSPNRRLAAPEIRLVRFRSSRGAEIRGLFAAAASVASAPFNPARELERSI
jgi:hypothetical protein